jgi:DNA-binding protein HU-beta
MNNKELVSAIFEYREKEIPKHTIIAVIDTFIGVIATQMSRGEEVRIPDFGTFSVLTTPARMGRNPGTGEAIEIPEKQAVKFKAAKKLKDAANSYDEPEGMCGI